MKKYLAVLFYLTAMVVSAEELTLSPGSLSGLLTDPLRQTHSLVLKGEADVRDFNVLSENFNNLSDLDISNLKITAYCEPADMDHPAVDYAADVLPDNAFFGMPLRRVVLPQSLVAIGSGAFSGTSVESITIPASVERIGDYAFSGCEALQSVVLPEAVTELGDYLFSGCVSLASADLSSLRIASLPRNTFYNCAVLASLSLPSGLTELGDYSLYGTEALTSFTIPAGIVRIGESAMQGCGAQTLAVPESTESVGDYAFAMMPSVAHAASLSSSVKYGEGVFFSCPALVSQALNLTEIPDMFFAGSESLRMDAYGLLGIRTVGAYGLARTATEELDLGNSLVSLGDRAMQGMTALKKISAVDLYDNPPALGEDVFEGIDQPSVKLTVRHPAARQIWAGTPQWNEFNIEVFSGIDDVESEVSDIKAWFEGALLHIRASEEIESVAVFGTDGLEAGRISPYSTDAEFDTSDLSGCIYIVVVATTGAERTFKLMR